MKQRYSSLDVKVIAQELNNVLPSLRVTNIYDLSTRIFLFKLAKPGVPKQQLLIDAGFRAHLTSFSRTTAAAPSAFTTRLRKCLKTRRITSVLQLGTDRVIEIAFSDGQYRLFLEFFAAGNVVLTDAELNVLALLRVVREDNEEYDIQVGTKYNLEAKQNYSGVPALTEDRAKDVLQKAADKFKGASEIGGKKAKRSRGKDEAAKALGAGFSEYPAHLIEHAFSETGVDPSTKVDVLLADQEAVAKVMTAMKRADEIFKSLETAKEVTGYIIAKEKTQKTVNESGETSQQQSTPDSLPSRDQLLYDDYHPFKPAQLANSETKFHILSFPSYNATVDEFYSSIESQTLSVRLAERSTAAEKKVQAAKDEYAKKLGALQAVQELHVRKAQAIEANAHRVEEACAAVNGLIGQGMDWVDIGKLIEREQGRGNIVAQTIKLPLKLEENTVTLLLDEGDEEEDESEPEDETDSEDENEDDGAPGSSTQPPTAPRDKRLTIDIDLALSPYANARQYYEQKKSVAVKEQKTILASVKALKSTESKIEADLKKSIKQEKTALRPARNQFWFEKFLYFISSDGYLIIGGKDVQQNELIYRRHLARGDVFVHADLPGASAVIVKNHPDAEPDAPIPPGTLSQAGIFTICTSTAWDSKAVMAAWWVPANHVSKTAETGEYLATGGFVVRGKKNFLPPAQLILGFGVAWLINEESRANHGKHRLGQGKKAVNDEVTVQNVAASEADAVPDLEDTAETAEDEAQQDNKAVEEESDDDGDDQDIASNTGSEAHLPRSNPLQTNHIDDDHGVAPSLQHQPRESPTIEENTQKDDDDKEEEDGDDQDSSLETATATSPVSLPTTRTDTPTSSTAPSIASSTPSSKPNTKKTSTQTPRGKLTKAKKRALQKYAEQDDEDRDLAMSLLGTNKAVEKKATAESAKAEREAQAARDRERRRQQHAKAVEREKERMQRLAAAAAGGKLGSDNAGAGKGEDAADAEEEKERLERETKEHLTALHRLVPAPESGDVLVSALPVVAPWTALSRTKYKVKLQPGSLKKGKAVREMVGNWTSIGAKPGGARLIDEGNRDKDRVWARELELLKEWRVEEVVGALPVKGVRIVQGGGFGGAAAGGGKAGGAKSGKHSAGPGGKKGR